MKYMFFISLALSLITTGRGSIKYMLNMIRHLQFIFHMAIFSYTIPPIYLSFIQIIMPIMMFDMLDGIIG